MEQRSQGMSNNGNRNVLGDEAQEQLEELRQYRPSVFQALPRDPAESGRVLWAGERE